MSELLAWEAAKEWLQSVNPLDDPDEDEIIELSSIILKAINKALEQERKK